MILITGGTGFIGRNLTRHLAMLGKPVRILLSPASDYSRLPKGMNIEVAISSLSDTRSLQAALRDVDTVVHLAGSERRSTRADFENVDITGTRNLVEVAQERNVDRFVMLSHIGANRASAYPVLRAKAVNEYDLGQSRLNYTIVRTSAVFGPDDQFTTSLAKLIRRMPFVFLMPSDGKVMLQPLFVDDLAVCLLMILDDPAYAGQTLTLGGLEYLSLHDIVQTILRQLKTRRLFVPVTPAYLRALSIWYENSRTDVPISVYWLDYLAADRTASIDVLPRLFGIMPARFANNIQYLSER